MTAALTIRRAEAADCPRLTAVAHAAKRRTPAFVRDHPTFVAADGDEIVGFYALKSFGDALELEHMWVTPERIGRGVGVTLFRHAAREATARGVRTLRIAADPHAEAFYVQQGARRIGDVPSTPTGRRLPLLLLELAPGPTPDGRDDRG